ncbi:hypothetical protein [Streptomyces sp. NPDC018610]|uniref:hypothetical protein n=1 Tax=Streptomyces sp. NPDC018610 TaxID=3365049 RepID=UPI0037B9DFD3
MSAVRPAALAGLALTLLTVAGCGVPTSGVIDAGEPAVGASASIEVWFLDDGVPRGVPRRVPAKGDVVAGAVRLLLAGPTAAESATLTTSLPAVRGEVGVTTDGDAVSVRFPAGVERLGPLAMEQLTCTVAEAHRLAAASPSPTARAGTPTSVPPLRADGQAHDVSVRAVGDTWATARPDTVCPAG